MVGRILARRPATKMRSSMAGGARLAPRGAAAPRQGTWAHGDRLMDSEIESAEVLRSYSAALKAALWTVTDERELGYRKEVIEEVLRHCLTVSRDDPMSARSGWCGSWKGETSVPDGRYAATPSPPTGLERPLSGSPGEALTSARESAPRRRARTLAVPFQRL